ncbi:hypothetical protein PV-S19_0182 [Pacmanvirus S19]|nr:hypothetical protein PV-S19_0182 [Pacmanvirus S19]
MCDNKNRKLCANNQCQICFNKSFASSNKAQYWSVKNIINPRDIFKATHDNYWFACDICKHEFELGLNRITSGGTWCPYCAVPSRKLCEDIDCAYCFDKSFASQEKSKYLSPKNNINPREIFKSSSRKYIFDCEVCNHEFITGPNVISNGSWCPYCAIPTRILCNDDECAYCFDRSFASHDRSKYWSNKNQLTPRKVVNGSQVKYWFNCDCGHEFESSPGRVIKELNWCPYCCIPVLKLCQNITCNNCFDKSFASHRRSNYWSPKNNISPRDITLYSNKKYLFDCDICNHEFETTISSITNGSWCPKCKNKTELKLYNVLKDVGYDIESQLRVDWCRNPETNSYLPFDFLLEEYKVIIELDGEQHFKQVSNWKSPGEQQKKDKYKMDCANKQGYTVIRIFQEDVWCDRIDWLSKLEEHIYLHDIPTRIYISSGNHYDVY